ncbi:unnamed protein product [Mytilus coruscus]|uniref:Ubiquitin-like protease family profile domain-containing protein n=1 Tax=Mytilus coruscus TaxID=42192 RepID=A0A6J8C7E1_MYTCO|nr:unnamed protein product [Mytilus coruscus]
MTEKTVLMPVNIDNKHWILLAILADEKTIVYMDPLGNYDENIVGKMMNFLQLWSFLSNNGKLDQTEWQVVNAATSPMFPTQTDYTSCGIYVCLYIRQIIKEIQMHSSCYQNESSLRKYLLFEILQICYFDHNQQFGLKEVMQNERLDNFVLPILSADLSTLGAQYNRHKVFLKDLIFFSTKMMINFGSAYLTPESVCKIEQYLRCK